jgi:carboxyl-terminal processing protease
MAKKHLRWALLPLAVAVGLFFLLEKNFLPGAAPQTQPRESLQLLNGIMRLIEQDYVEEPDPVKTMSGAFKGLVNSLDVLSSYLDAESVAKFKDQERRDLNETGLIVYKRQGAFPVVLGIKEGSPAAASDIQLGDHLYTLDDRTTLELSMLELKLYLKDTSSQPVKMKTTRNAKNITLEIPRARLHNASYSFSRRDNLAGVLQIHTLRAPLVKALDKDLISSLKNSENTLVVDLRNCADGDLEEALRFMNLFLQKKDIGLLEKKGGQNEILACPEPAPLADIPLILWINQATLGPAEMTAHVLQSFRDTKIIGHKTLGLVARQRFFPLSDGTGLVLTSAIYRPSDDRGELWQVGVTPDIKMKADEQSPTAFMEQTRKLVTSR